MVVLAILALSLILIGVAVWATKQKNTIGERIEAKKSELASAEQKAEATYQREKLNSEIAYKECKEETTPRLLRFCYEPFVIKHEPLQLRSDLAELAKVSNKSWGGLFLNRAFQNDSDRSSPVYALIVLFLWIPILRLVFILVRKGIQASKGSVKKIQAVNAEVQQLPVFQRYLLVLLASIVVLFLLAIVLRIF